MLFLLLILNIFLIAYIGFPVYADSVEDTLFKTFFKKDDKRLNKVRVHTSNIYGNNEEQYENFF